MGILQSAREKPAFVGAAAAGITLIGVLAVGFEMFGRSHRAPAAAKEAFYSDDDGKTWFVDDIDKFPPFDHNGKPAYRAGVFRCGSAEPFVAYLQRFTDREKKELQAAIAKDPDQKSHWMQSPAEIRKPGESTWRRPMVTSTPAELAAYEQLLSPLCPDGSNATPVLPPADAEGGAAQSGPGGSGG
jgi:hypothetical protein